MSGLDEFVVFCSGLKLENGDPFELEGFEQTVMADYFDGVRESLVLLPKKNGKSTLLAAVALHHLITTDNAMCPIAAATRDQAMWIFDQARGFVQRSDELQRHVRVLRGYREVRRRPPDLVNERPKEGEALFGMVKVLAADEDHADGVIPTLALVDELHRHKKAELYAVFRDGLGPRDGRMITISTAGDDEESPLGELRKAAHELPGMKRDGAYRYVRTDDFAMHEWALDDDQDRDDMEVVKSANPASWQTVEELRRRHDSPSMKPWQWARFACGVWLQGEEGAFSEREWRSCEDVEAEIPEGSTGVFVGVDLGWRWDTTAIVPIWHDANAKFVIGDVEIIVPPRDGSAIQYDTIWKACEELADRYAHPTFVIDPKADGEQLAQQLEKELDCDVVIHAQTAEPMALAAQRLSKAIATEELRQPGNPVLTRHVLAAKAKSVGEGWRLVKPKQSVVIDGVVALAMGLSVAIGSLSAPDWGPMVDSA